MPRVALYVNIISPHQMPLAREIIQNVGVDNFRYIYTEPVHAERKNLGWCVAVPDWCISVDNKEALAWLEKSDLLISGHRDFDLFQMREKNGLVSFYQTERWFKPPIGMLRLLHPRYFGYARRLCRMMSEGFLVGFPIGIYAASDMARLCGLMHGDFRCLFRAPKLDFERKPGGKVWLKNGGNGKRYCLDKMRMWGYFVEPSQNPNPHSLIHNSSTLKVLWVGRLLNWKRVDTIIHAVGELSTRSTCSTRFTLDIYGTGPEESRLKELASKYGDAIKFHPPVPIDEVRQLMRDHDIYVLTSNAYEGWGAVVSEALEEGMKVIGTYEAGGSATILPKENLFYSADWKRLRHLLLVGGVQTCIGKWTALKAAKYLATYDNT